MSDVVVFIHGMGTFAQGWSRLKDGPRSTFDSILQQTFPTQSWKGLGISFEEIVYADVFEDYRQRWAAAGKGLQAVGLGSVGRFLDSFDQRSFVMTHLLDVAMFRLLREPYFDVVDHVRRQLLDIAERSGGAEISIIAHSLGTSVIHETLRGATRLNDPLAILGPRILKTLTMVANVSRILQGSNFDDVYTTPVNPGRSGVVAQYLNVHHACDPFTLVQPFHEPPTGWGEAVPGLSGYQDVEVDAITDWNTHDFSHYLRDPAVHLPLLENLSSSLKLSSGQAAQLVRAYRTNALTAAMRPLLTPIVEKANLATVTEDNLGEAWSLWADFLESGHP